MAEAALAIDTTLSPSPEEEEKEDLRGFEVLEHELRRRMLDDGPSIIQEVSEGEGELVLPVESVAFSDCGLVSPFGAKLLVLSLSDFEPGTNSFVTTPPLLGDPVVTRDNELFGCASPTPSPVVAGCS